MTSVNNSLPIPEFNGTKYEYWSIRMKTLLTRKGLWNIVVTGYTEPANWSVLNEAARKAKEEDQKKDSLALSHIQSALAENLFPRIASCTNAFEAWKALKDAYQGNTQVKQVRLQTFKREFENLRMQEYKAIGDYYVRVKAIIDQMETLGEEVKPKVVVKKVLRTLLRKWDHIAIIIEESKDLSTLSFDALIGSLTSHEEQLQDPSNFGSEDKAFSTQG